MAAKQKPSTPASEPVQKPESDAIILTQAEHASLSDKEKADFRTKGGTVSNQ